MCERGGVVQPASIMEWNTTREKRNTNRKNNIVGVAKKRTLSSDTCAYYAYAGQTHIRMQRKKKKKIATTILFEGRKITTIFRTMYPFIRNICYMRYVFEFGPFHIPACILHLSALSELRNVRSNCCSLAHDRTPNLLYTYTIHHTQDSYSCALLPMNC